MCERAVAVAGPRAADTGGTRAASPSLTELSFYIPYPPSVNDIWRHTSRGVFISEVGLAYRKQCGIRLMQQKVPRWDRGIRGRLGLEIKALPPKQKRKFRDLDNLLKASLDALQHCGVIENDGHFDRIVIERGAVADFEVDGVLFLRIRQLEVQHGSPR